METYRATFDISCGVSHGLGVKYPDTETREERIVAENPDDALKQALTYATRFAYDYLSDPETGKTTVALSHLRGPTGTVPLDTTKTIVERSTLDKILLLAVEEVLPKERKDGGRF